jgi:glycerol-3-phosphate O-acyltransferase/dihydroxyacetone phosphate acyltransferase
MQVKDGAAWAALEYMKWAREHPEMSNKKPVQILPAAIVYTNKSKYRSDVRNSPCARLATWTYLPSDRD